MNELSGYVVADNDGYFVDAELTKNGEVLVFDFKTNPNVYSTIGLAKAVQKAARAVGYKVIILKLTLENVEEDRK